jgi:hypothetical protein
MRPHAIRAETAALQEENMHRLRGLAATLLLVLAVPLDATDPLGAFADEWKGVTVVLKKPLYTFAYSGAWLSGWFGSSPNMGSIATGLKAGSFGVTRIAPGKGIYYLCTTAKSTARTIVDTDVHRLAQRVKGEAGSAAMTPQTRTGQLATKDNAVQLLKVITYQRGTELVVKRILYGVSSNSGLKIELTLPQEPTAEPVTHLFVEWPTPFSAEFVERPKVEELMAEFFERVKR